jgi:acyl-CoA synthetase (AMP-forming)/AMP-acid ligase II
VNEIYALLTQRAELDPEGVAVASLEKQLSFSQLKSIVDIVAEELLGLGVSSQQFVWIVLPRLEGWIVSLSLIKIGAVGCSALEGEARTSLDSNIAALVIHDQQNYSGTAPAIRFDHRWINTESRGELSAAFEFESGHFYRAISTSGSSGRPKLAMFQASTIGAKIDSIDNLWGSKKKELNLMPLSSTGGFATGLASLIHGTPFFCPPSTKSPSFLSFVSQNQIEVLTGSPDQIAGFLEKVRASYFDAGFLSEIKMAGGVPNSTLTRSLWDQFQCRIHSVYGTTETGSVFSQELSPGSESQLLGAIRNGCEVRVTSEVGKVLHGDCEGLLEVKSDTGAAGYLLEAESLSVQPIPEWFSTGDSVFRASGEYGFVRRDTAVLNFGGNKFLATEVEDFARSIDGIIDALCFVFQDKNGRELLGMALELDNPRNLKHFSSAISQQFPGRAPGFFWHVSEFPKASLGKPARWLLAERFTRERTEAKEL